MCGNQLKEQDSLSPGSAPTLRAVGMTFWALVAMVACVDSATHQPIPFNHQIHTKNDLTCDTCHENVFKGPHAGIPKVEVCLQCHSDDITKNPAAKPWIEMVRKHGVAGTEIPWVRIYQVPGHVYYSHRRHAGIAALPCATCHGDIGQSSTPPLRPVAATINMDTCMACHVERGVEIDCDRCHR